MIQNLKTELGAQTEKTQEMFNKELDDLKSEQMEQLLEFGRAHSDVIKIKKN